MYVSKAMPCTSAVAITSGDIMNLAIFYFLVSIPTISTLSHARLTCFLFSLSSITLFHNKWTPIDTTEKAGISGLGLN